MPRPGEAFPRTPGTPTWESEERDQEESRPRHVFPPVANHFRESNDDDLQPIWKKKSRSQ